MITNLKHLSELKNEQQQHNKHCAQLRPHKHAVRLVFNDKYLLEFHKIKDFQESCVLTGFAKTDNLLCIKWFLSV